jgi:predicted transcriptional regulator
MSGNSDKVVRRMDVGIVHRMVREIDHQSTGYLFRVARKKAKLSLREVARRLKLSAPFVSDLELGRRNWTEEMAERYIDILCPPNTKGKR